MDTIKEAFDAVAKEYDAQREFVIPQMREYYGAAVWAAESQHPLPRILDIGAGTGLLSAMLRKKYPDAPVTLLDISEKMLGIARERFTADQNVSFKVGDYSTVDLGGPYDLVCSALSIHHLDDDAKRRLFVRIAAAISPGGLFVNADQSEGETAYFSRRYRGYWDNFVQSGPLSSQEWEEVRQRRDTLDRNATLSDQLAWLRDAGFSDVDVVYRNRTFIVTVARKT